MIEEHISQCTECLEERAIWRKLSLLTADEPSRALTKGFHAMLRGYEAGLADRIGAGHAPGLSTSPSRIFRWLLSPAAAVAWSICLVMLGGYVGIRVSSSSHSQQSIRIQRQLANAHEKDALLMLQEQSASSRLQAIAWTRQEQFVDTQVLSALLNTLCCDPSAGVRLAALDALSRHVNEPQVRKSIVDALQKNQSPLVQVALIDLFLEWRDREGITHLRALLREPGLNPAVRQRADWVIRNVS